MKVLILGLNYAPETIGIGIYTAGMAEYLAEAGHSVRVIAAKPYYPQWKIMDGHSPFGWSRRNENDVRITRVPHYIPANPTTARRLLHHLSFALGSAVPALWSGIVWRPDIVLTIAPSLIAAPVARIAALCAGAKSWLHVQDFEVEAAFATGLMEAKGASARLAHGFERTVLSLFDIVSTISPPMCARLADKGVPNCRIVEFRNWADIETIRPLTSPSAFRARWDIATPHVALYSGSIANKQGLEIIVKAASLLKGRTDLTFVVCGEGPNKQRLEQQATGLRNIRFHDLQPRDDLHELLGLATIHLLPQRPDTADLLFPSKLANMFASGRPVIATAAEGTALAEEVDGRGLVTPPEDTAAFAAAISTLCDDRTVRDRLGAAARRHAEQRLSRHAILRAWETEVVRILSPLVPERMPS
ncbi:WcaI family glycosyltransferase [Pelagibacterium lacus]|uniref:Colanic acid biosynthesis glycosyltransferase WcaI n=1 Tax=Pelagibacterium lacus TaxID=2282655 RepID=A0A369W7D1_9HYPH|nr:WcaI family glycosyltransferase [Pelagibacterium lacus]RDE09142.1 colanic acid biosynthesis glycosyltransferase WcaI [Pelagibacterium lacus]